MNGARAQAFSSDLKAIKEAKDKWKIVDGDCRECNEGLVTYHVDAFNEGYNLGANQTAELVVAATRHKTLEEVQALLDHSLAHYKQLLENQFTNSETKAIVAGALAFILKFQEAVQQLRESK